MPIRVGRPLHALPVEPTQPTPPAQRVRDVPRMSWYPPGGGEIPLTTPAAGWRLLRGVQGIGGIRVNLNTERLPGGGVHVRAVRREHREIDLPVRIWGRTHDEFVARRRVLCDAFEQTDELGPGRLVVWRPDGSMRQIHARYLEGLDKGGDGWIAETAIITLLCEQPWWLGPTVEADERVHQTGSGSFLDPFPNVSSSKTLGEAKIINPGELTAYPTWVITGPTSMITLTHVDTGESFTVNPDWDGDGDLAQGDTVTVVTDPLHMRVTGPDGSPWTGALDWPGAALFGLRPGANHVLIELQDADVGTGVSWTFAPRYRSS